MTRIRITNMHGFAIEEIAKFAAEAESAYTRRVLQAAVMTGNGMTAEVVTKTWAVAMLQSLGISTYGMNTTSKEPRITGISKTGGPENVRLHALDETGIGLESVKISSWEPVGVPCAINGDYEGLNIVGAIKILRDHRFHYSSRPSEEGTKAHHIGRFLDKLMSREEGEVHTVWDNSPTQKATAEKYESKYEGRLHLLFAPLYSPELDPQENIWCWVKAYCARNRAYLAVEELSAWIGKSHVYTYDAPSRVRKQVDVKPHFKAA